MKEKERRKKHGNDVNVYYKRIVESVNQSFQDVMIAFAHLPENQKTKIDLITSYEGILRQIRRKKLSTELPDTTIKSATVALDSALDFIGSKDRHLENMVEPDFQKVIKWLRYIEKKPKSVGVQI